MFGEQIIVPVFKPDLLSAQKNRPVCKHVFISNNRWQRRCVEKVKDYKVATNVKDKFTHFLC